MKLIQVFIPLSNPHGVPFPPDYFKGIREVLTDRFGGLTIYQRSPAVGLWKESQGPVVKDDIVIFEVMADAVDSEFWSRYKAELTTLLEQDELLIRCQEVVLL